MKQKHTKIVRTKVLHRIELSDVDILDAIRAKHGRDAIPGDVCIEIYVEGIGDQLSMEIDTDSPVVVEWCVDEAKTEEEI